MKPQTFKDLLTMAQVKIFGMKAHLMQYRHQISDAVHTSITEAFRLPPDKKFQRFFPMEPEDFLFPAGRSDQYTIIEVLCFKGRSVAAKCRFYELVADRLQKQTGISLSDLEIIINESSPSNWYIRGSAGHQLKLPYQISI